MAKVVPAPLDPGSVNQSRGRFLVYEKNGVWMAQAWPRKRGSAQNWRTMWLAQQWAYASRMTANAYPLDQQTAVYMTAGTEWLPRDLLARAVYGTAYEVYNDDGAQWRVTSKAPPLYRRSALRAWQWNRFDNAYNTTWSPSAFNLKGAIIRPMVRASLQAVQAIFNPLAATEYRLYVCRCSIGAVIQEVVQSDLVVTTTADLRPYLFPIQTDLLPGERYAILVGRTTGSPTYALPVSYSADPVWQWPCLKITSASLAAFSPTLGAQVVNTGATSSPPFALDLEF